MTSVFSLYVQVQDCLQQNNELRATLNQLRLEQSSMITATDRESSGIEAHAGDEGSGNKTASEGWQAERTKLKVTVRATFMKEIVLEDFLCLVFAIFMVSILFYQSLDLQYVLKLHKIILLNKWTCGPQIELAKALARSEELSAQMAQQSADLNRAVQALTSLSSL